MARFTRYANETCGAGADSPEALWRWSIREPAAFWNAVWDFCGVIGERGERVVVDFDRLPGARWYPDARLNYAENLLRRRDDGPALLFRAEDRVRRDLTWAELYDTTSRLAQALDALGIEPGDRVAGYVPNMPESIVYMLASASLGATISTASPDFGVQGVLDRFGQIEPRVLLAADGYFWQGKRYSSLDRLPEIVRRLPSVER
ncbi:MAG: AMP-binding protein, partial [Gemmatimonadales bacterium]|nr:AMP-binding protein [Gemmatimonadales bacterium]